MSKSADLKKSILGLLGKEGGRPLNKSEIARALELPGSQRKDLRISITQLLEDGEISQGKKGRFMVGGSEKTEAKGQEKGVQGKGRRSGSRSAKGSKSGGRMELVGKLKVNAAAPAPSLVSLSKKENSLH